MVGVGRCQEQHAGGADVLAVVDQAVAAKGGQVGVVGAAGRLVAAATASSARVSGSG